MIFGQLERASRSAIGGDELPIVVELDTKRGQAEHAFLTVVSDASSLPVHHSRCRHDLDEAERASAAAHVDELGLDVPLRVLEAEQPLLAELPLRRDHPVETGNLAGAEVPVGLEPFVRAAMFVESDPCSEPAVVVRFADERQLPVAVARPPAALRVVGEGAPPAVVADIVAVDGDEEGAPPPGAAREP